MSSVVLIWSGAIAIGVSLGLLGSGGSILTVPVLVYLMGQDEKVAIAGSLAIVGTISLIGSLPYLRSRQIDLRSVVLFGGPGMAGTYIGAWSATYVPGIVQLTLFALVMLIASWFMFRPMALEAGAQGTRRAPLKIGLDGLGVGMITGLVGVGGGFLIVPALVFLGGLSMHRAVATSLVIIALKSYTGFWKYLDVLHEQNLELDWSAIALVSGLGIAGSFAGNRIANRVLQDQLKRIFGAFLIVMGIYILARSVPSVLSL